MTTVDDQAVDHAPAVADDRPWLPRRRDILDQLAASDPGLNRFRLAVVTLATIGVALVAEYAFVHLTGALLLPTPPGAPAAALVKIAAQHHAIVVIAMLMGAIMGMLSGFGVNDPTVRGQMTTLALMPFPVTAAMFAGLALSKHRIASLILITVALGIGVYLRRFGPRGFVGGMLLFMGAFLGYFIGADVALSQGGWLVCFLLLGLAVAALLKLTVFRPRPQRVLERTMRAFRGRARQVVSRTITVLDGGPNLDRNARLLRRRLVRLNEAALMIDAQVNDPASLPDGTDAGHLHQGFFDLELGYQNLGRRVEILTRLGVPDIIRDPLRRSLVALSHGLIDEAELDARVLLDTLSAHPELPDQAAAFSHRIAVTILTLVDGIRTWTEVVRQASTCPYQTPVMLMMGNLAGSALVSQESPVSEEDTSGRRWRLGYSAKAAIQIMVATGVAIAIGDQLSGRRYYWAVIAVMVTSMGTNTAGEKVTKAVNRVIGTVIGIVIGSLAVHAAGGSTVWSLTVVMVALFFGLYLMRISYVFMTIGITTMISQLYVQLDEFTNSLLVLRLEETAIGAAVGLVVALVVFPVSTRKAAARATGNYLAALADILHGVTEVFGDGPERMAARQRLRTLARGLDDHLQQLLYTVQPLRRNPFGRARLRASVARFDATAHQARNLAVDAAEYGPVDPCVRAEVTAAGDRIGEAIGAMAHFAKGRTDNTYHRSGAALDRIDRSLERRGVPLLRGDRLAVHHLVRVDTMMAELAREIGMVTVDDSDDGARGDGPRGGASGGDASAPAPVLELQTAEPPLAEAEGLASPQVLASSHALAEPQGLAEPQALAESEALPEPMLVDRMADAPTATTADEPLGAEQVLPAEPGASATLPGSPQDIDDRAYELSVGLTFRWRRSGGSRRDRGWAR